MRQAFAVSILSSKLVKNGSLYNAIPGRDLIGLAAMVYEPLYHAREIATIKLSSGCSCKAKSAKTSNISCTIFFPLTLVGYEMIIDNLALRASKALVE